MNRPLTLDDINGVLKKVEDETLCSCIPDGFVPKTTHMCPKHKIMWLGLEERKELQRIRL